MVSDGKFIAKKISDLADEVALYKGNKEKLVQRLEKFEVDFKVGKIPESAYITGQQNLLHGKSKDEIIKSHNQYINQLLDAIEKESDKILMLYGATEQEVKPTKKSEVIDTGKYLKISKKQKEVFMQEVNIDKEFLELYARRKKKDGSSSQVRVEYQLYKSSTFGSYANRVFEKFTVKLTKKYPQYFEPLYNSLRMSGLKVLSKTYVSIILLVGLLSLFFVTLFASLFFKHSFLPLQIIRGIVLGVLGGIAGLAVAYFYPQSLSNQRTKAINNDLPFMIIHMAAVSGSGAKPISMFKTILSSGEYPGLRDEVKKIVNYVALFGYDLSTALKAVARRTPSVKFKDMLDGIVSNIQSGGDLKEYLQAMADESLTTYRLERKRQVESIATYADIYTAILIAAPLLFFVTLVIIQKLGGTIGGAQVDTIAKVGTFGVIPAMNVAYLVFLNIVSPE